MQRNSIPPVVVVVVLVKVVVAVASASVHGAVICQQRFVLTRVKLRPA